MMAWQRSSHSWLFDGHNSQRRSSWLQSTLSELDEKTKAMIKLIEEDADSFGKRAEMYYKKRPELLSMVEDFYQAHRSLAERFDHLKLDSKNRLMLPLWKSYDQLKLESRRAFSPKHQSNKVTNPVEKSYDTFSEISYSESWESEVDDPEEEEHKHLVVVDGKMVEEKEEEECGKSDVDDPDQVLLVDTKSMDSEIELMKLREEIKRLQEENQLQREQLMQKDEEKREVIRQLSSSLEIMRENVIELRKKNFARESNKTKSPIEFSKLKGLFSSNLFGGLQSVLCRN